MIRPCRCQGAAGYWQQAHVRPLSDDEARWADSVGEERYRRAQAAGWADYLGQASAASHRIGARGELAFCILSGIPWGATLNSFRDHPDVEPDYEIRTARLPYLKLRPDDPTDVRTRDRRFVLLTLAPAEYRDDWLTEGASFVLHGWLRGGEARGEPLSDPGDRRRPAYFVPAERLHLFPADLPHGAPAEIGA